MGQPELFCVVKAIDGDKLVTLERIDLDPFVISGRDNVNWGLSTGSTLNMAITILNHLCGWKIDAQDMADRKPTESGPIMNLFRWLSRNPPSAGFTLLDVDIILIAWPRWWHRWSQISRLAWRTAGWLRILARKGPTGLRWHLNQLEVIRRDNSPWMVMKIVLEPDNPGTPFPKTFTEPKPRTANRGERNTDR